MPLCHVPGCLYHALELRAGHKCNKCKKEVHTLCAHHLPDEPADSNLVCFACVPACSTTAPMFTPAILNEERNEEPRSTTAKKKKSATTSERKRKKPFEKEVTNTKTAGLKTVGLNTEDKVTRTKPTGEVAPKKIPSLKKVSVNKDDERIKKTISQQKTFILKNSKAQADPLLMKSVWFDIASEYGQQLSQYFGAEKLKKYLFQDVSSKKYLKGTVARKLKQKGGA